MYSPGGSWVRGMFICCVAVGASAVYSICPCMFSTATCSVGCIMPCQVMCSSLLAGLGKMLTEPFSDGDVIFAPT